MRDEHSVIDLGTKESDSLYIRPCNIIFPVEKTIARGYLAYSNNERSFGFATAEKPIDSEKNPIQYLELVIRLASPEFKKIIQDTYLNNKNIFVGKTLITWGDYEHLLAGKPYYKGVPGEAEIIAV